MPWGRHEPGNSRETRLQKSFALLLLARLLYPFFDSPLTHVFSDPQRHWDNGELFLHPSMMGSSDPYLYQAWMWLLRVIAHGQAAPICLGCGLLCAAMPYGWYRALRELADRRRALIGALIIGLLPDSISLYAYFMNETLLITLLGFCFWLTFRARRKRTVSALAPAAALWIAAAFTRTVAVPMAALFIVWLIAGTPRRLWSTAAVAALLLIVALPAGRHAEQRLRFFAPLGNLYFNEIYSLSGRHDIVADFGPDGVYNFGCPSFYNPTFYPFSSWTTDRTGTVSIAVDLARGRRDWIAEKTRVKAQRDFPAWRARWENALYVFFGQEWPNSDRGSVFGWLTLWTRWLWAPAMLVVAYAAARGRFQGLAWALPGAALGTLFLLLFQSEAVMEARYREPLNALFVASIWLLACGRAQRPAAAPQVRPAPAAAAERA